MDRFDHCDNGTFCAENKPLDPDRMDEVQAHPVRIGAFADKTPERPMGLTNSKLPPPLAVCGIVGPDGSRGKDQQRGLKKDLTEGDRERSHYPRDGRQSVS